MLIELKKFGTILVSRPAGKEAYLAFQPALNDLQKNEKVIVSFDDIFILTPSWADEFLSPLIKKYKNKIKLKNTDNPTVIETLKILNIS